MQYVLETNALTKRYKNFTALNGLTMHIPKGSIYGFVGRNGAGKTTLIRLICGLQEPDSGSYRIYGIKNTDPQIVRSRRRMGAVVETPSIYLDMNARDNIRQQYQIPEIKKQELFSCSLLAIQDEKLHIEQICINDILEQSIAGFYGVLVNKRIFPDIQMSEIHVMRELDKEAVRRIFDNV